MRTISLTMRSKSTLKKDRDSELSTLSKKIRSGTELKKKSHKDMG